jgi:hypothetical protein
MRIRSNEDADLPLGGRLQAGSRWVSVSFLMPSEDLEEYVPQFSPTSGAPAEPVRLASGALFIK